MLPRFLARTVWQCKDLEVAVTLSGFPSAALAEAHALAAPELRLRDSHLVLLMDDNTEHYLRQEHLGVRQDARFQGKRGLPLRAAPRTAAGRLRIERPLEEDPPCGGEEASLSLAVLLRRIGADVSFQFLARAVEPETPASSLSKEVITGAIQPLESDLHAAGWNEEQMGKWLQDYYPDFRAARARGELQTPAETARWVEERLSTFPSP